MLGTTKKKQYLCRQKRTRMFFYLKKQLMCRAIDKRNRQQPFDYRAAENFALSAADDEWVNNSYYFSAHDDKMSVFARLGKRVNKEEVWMAIYYENKLYSLKQEFFPVGESPLTVEQSGNNWTLSFRGILDEHDNAELHATFVASRPALDFTSHMPAARMAIAIANEPWNKAFFGQLQNVSGQCHYEQEGTLNGQLTLNGKTIDFSLPCVRDHSFGKRDWNYMNNHVWLMAVSGEQQFNYSLVSYPVMSALEVGHYRSGNGLHFMRQADLDFQQVAKGIVPKNLSLHMLLDNGQTIPVEARVLAGVTYHFQNGQYALHENIAEFRIDGTTCRGILEIGFNRDRERFFNQRNLKTIKR